MYYLSSIYLNIYYLIVLVCSTKRRVNLIKIIYIYMCKRLLLLLTWGVARVEAHMWHYELPGIFVGPQCIRGGSQVGVPGYPNLGCIVFTSKQGTTPAPGFWQRQNPDAHKQRLRKWFWIWNQIKSIRNQSKNNQQQINR